MTPCNFEVQEVPVKTRSKEPQKDQKLLSAVKEGSKTNTTIQRALRSPLAAKGKQLRESTIAIRECFIKEQREQRKEPSEFSKCCVNNDKQRSS